ncbi:MAG: hypothetical protein KUG77_29310 [Nannocystaceae bacterium]|nr:hypothetical protein [Nannocystaceae bacterium]
MQQAAPGSVLKLTMRILAVLPLALALLIPACDGGSSGGGAASADADGFVAIPNISGMKVKVPEGVKPNGVGGAAGFHTEDDSFQFVLQEVKGDAASTTFDQAKAGAEEFLFKKWIKSDKTDDGWVLTYETPKMDLSGDEAKEVGVMYSFEVRRKVGETTLKCYGSITKAEGLDAVVGACNSIKAG